MKEKPFSPFSLSIAFSFVAIKILLPLVFIFLFIRVQNSSPRPSLPRPSPPSSPCPSRPSPPPPPPPYTAAIVRPRLSRFIVQANSCSRSASKFTGGRSARMLLSFIRFPRRFPHPSWAWDGSGHLRADPRGADL